MKALPSIAFSEFHGTAGDVTARKINGGTVLNGRAQHSHVKSPKQSERRANFSFITRQWKTLSDEQVAAWSALARQHRERALIGGDVPLTAQNLYVCLNANRRVVGMPMTKDAPDDVHGSSYVAYDDIWITPEHLVFAGLRDPQNPNSRLIIKMASAESNGVTKLWGQTVVVGQGQKSDWGEVDMTTIYADQFGIPIVVGQKYFIEMYWIDENSGYVSEISRVCFPAVESESIHGHTYVARAQIKTDMVIGNANNRMDSCSMELAGPDKLMAFDVVAAKTGGWLAGLEFEHSGLDAAFDTKKTNRSWGYTRGTVDDSQYPYAVSLTEITIQNGIWGKTLKFSNRSGLFADNGEFFGTSPLMNV